MKNFFYFIALTATVLYLTVVRKKLSPRTRQALARGWLWCLGIDGGLVLVFILVARASPALPQVVIGMLGWPLFVLLLSLPTVLMALLLPVGFDYFILQPPLQFSPSHHSSDNEILSDLLGIHAGQDTAATHKKTERWMLIGGGIFVVSISLLVGHAPNPYVSTGTLCLGLWCVVVGIADWVGVFPHRLGQWIHQWMWRVGVPVCIVLTIYFGLRAVLWEMAKF